MLSKTGEPFTITRERDPVQRLKLFFTSIIQEKQNKVLEKRIEKDGGISMANFSNEKSIIEQLIETDDGIAAAYKILQEISYDEEERAKILEKERILDEYNAAYEYAKQKGFNKGAHNKTVEIAGTMKKQGFYIDQISSITGLSPSELESL